MGMAVDPQTFKAAMGRFPGAVTIITARSEAERRGITATAVCSVSAEPPSLLICVNRKTGTCASIGETGFFNINLLRDPSSELAMRFAGAGGATGEEKFTAGDWDEDTRGLPILKDALVAFCCEVREKVDAGSHAIFIGQIVDIRLGEGVPLLYERSRFHRLTPI
jgi:flavin reductase (DIM6/NTAB) family NADH-FMN oxidoreductase RutF